jgi:hypothetical protein
MPFSGSRAHSQPPALNTVSQKSCQAPSENTRLFLFISYLLSLYLLSERILSALLSRHYRALFSGKKNAGSAFTGKQALFYVARHCEVQSGEAIQTGWPPLDCFASLAMTRGSLAMTGRPFGANGQWRIENGECRVLETARSLPVIFHYPFIIFNSREARADYFARNDEGRVVIARREAAKQSRRRRHSRWIASLRPQ